MNKIINADCLDVIWQQTKPVMIFADPPDNLGLKYDGFAGKWPNDEAYLNWLYQVI